MARKKVVVFLFIFCRVFWRVDSPLMKEKQVNVWRQLPTCPGYIASGLCCVMDEHWKEHLTRSFCFVFHIFSQVMIRKRRRGFFIFFSPARWLSFFDPSALSLCVEKSFLVLIDRKDDHWTKRSSYIGPLHYNLREKRAIGRRHKRDGSCGRLVSSSKVLFQTIEKVHQPVLAVFDWFMDLVYYIHLI